MKKNTFLSFFGENWNNLLRSNFIIKLSLILILLPIIQVFPYESYSQQKVTFNLKDVTIKEVLNEIKSQTDFKFLYRNSEVNVNNKVTLVAENDTIKEILNRLFQNTEIKYLMVDKQIILTKKILTSESFKKVQSREITGTVTDSDGEPLPGASVIVKGTAMGASTDIDGKFTLNVEDDAAVLVVSYIGFETKEVPIGDASNYTIALTADAQTLDEVMLLGSRAKPRSNLDSAVPIDAIGVADLSTTGQADMGQQLQFSAPSFNAVKFGINDLAPLVDPASLRGLASDQTLLLVNGKRRHKVSFFSLNHGVGKGQLGNDINSIPAAAVKRVEILRDGAAAQYGSDAIAGVMNLQLNNARSGGSFKFYTGVGYSNPKYDGIGSNANLEGQSIYGRVKDGETAQMSLNFGLPWGEKGYVNTTLNFQNSEPYDRSGKYTHSEGWYPDDPNLTDAENQAIDEQLRYLNGIDLDRTVLGSVKNTNGSFFINAGNEITEDLDFYAFGGVLRKRIVGSIFSRAPARDDRAVLEIFPNGFNPQTPSVLTDWQIVSGIKGELENDWTVDFSAGYSGNDLQLYINNTLNPSLGVDSPSEFYTGGLQVTQTVFNADFVKKYENVSLIFGSELRFESFEQTAGEADSWRVGSVLGKDIGSSGREGFSDVTAGRYTRNNIGIYGEIEADLTESLLTTAAIRFENYSDFGADFSYKLAGRYKIGEKASIRTSLNRSFRAPALTQVEYTNFAVTTFDDVGNTLVTPFLPVSDPVAQSAFGDISLKPETSLDFAVGLTFEPSRKFSFTLDAYNVDVKDRIVVSSGIDASLFTEFAATNYNEVNIFTNALNTTTTGFDFVGTYTEFLGDDKLDLSLGINLNKTKVNSINKSEVFTKNGIDIVDDRDVVFLTKGTPNRKVILSGTYKTGRFGFTARGSNFGEVTDARETIADGSYQVFSPKTVFDLSIAYNVSDNFSITAGANNIFDTYPDMLFSPNVRGEVIYSRRTNQFGTQGRFLNLALNYNW